MYFDATALLETQRNLENVISIISYQKYETYWHSDLVDPLPSASPLSTRITQTLPERFWEQRREFDDTDSGVGNENDTTIMQAKKIE